MLVDCKLEIISSQLNPCISFVYYWKQHIIWIWINLINNFNLNWLFQIISRFSWLHKILYLSWLGADCVILTRVLETFWMLVTRVSFSKVRSVLSSCTLNKVVQSTKCTWAQDYVFPTSQLSTNVCGLYYCYYVTKLWKCKCRRIGEFLVLWKAGYFNVGLL